MSTTYELCIFKGLEGFQELRSDWQTLYDRIQRTHIFQSPQWYESYLTTLSMEPDNFHIVAIYEQGRIRAIIPVNRHIHKIAGLEFIILEVPEHPDITYRDILTDNQSPPIDIYELLCKNRDMQRLLPWDMLRIKKAYGTSSAMQMVPAATGAQYFKKKVGTCGMLFLAPFEIMVNKLSKNSRKKWRNKRNQLQKQPGFRYQTARSAMELKEAYRLFLEVESSGWKGQEESAIKFNKQSNEFYKKLLTIFSLSGSCEINLLWIEGKPVAAEYVLIGPTDAYTLKAGYNESYKSFSPGHFLLEYMMQHYHETHSHIRWLNLMSGFSYLDYLHPEKEDVVDLHLFQRSIKGDLFSTFVRLQYLVNDVFIKKMKQFIIAHPAILTIFTNIMGMIDKKYQRKVLFRYEK